MGKECKRVCKPATNPEARENQLISLAYDLAEQRLRDGSATSQEVTHFLKMGSARNRIELDKMRNENILISAKTEALQSNKKIEELYENALNSMRLYGGSDEEDCEDDYSDL